jgi:hypothetical protein
MWYYMLGIQQAEGRVRRVSSSETKERNERKGRKEGGRKI